MLVGRQPYSAKSKAEGKHIKTTAFKSGVFVLIGRQIPFGLGNNFCFMIIAYRPSGYDAIKMLIAVADLPDNDLNFIISDYGH